MYPFQLVSPVESRAAMGYDPRIHHRRSLRLPGYDYAQPGAYYVTICTDKIGCIFEDDHLRGVVERSWVTIVDPKARIDVGDFVVMPNHVHGVVWIDEHAPVGARHQTPAWDEIMSALPERGSYLEPGFGASPLHPAGNSSFALRTGFLGAIVGAFKSSAARRINNIRRTRGEPVWQPGFYDHIIRNDEDLRRVREYILDNPRKWAEDPDNPANLRKPSGRA